MPSTKCLRALVSIIEVATDQRRAPRQTVAPVITQRRELGQVELLAVCDRRAKILPVWLYTGVIIQEGAMAESGLGLGKRGAGMGGEGCSQRKPIGVSLATTLGCARSGQEARTPDNPLGQYGRV